MSRGRVRVFIACSLDGFIAGPGDDLAWLPTPAEGDGDFGYAVFMDGVGALLVGRKTYEVAAAFPDWPYGERPVLVATHGALAPRAASVRAVVGDVRSLLDDALASANGKDVYLDGGALIRDALDASRIDELTISICPTILGGGASLFSGLASRCALDVVGSRTYAAGLVQIVYRPRPGG